MTKQNYIATMSAATKASLCAVLALPTITGVPAAPNVIGAATAEAVETSSHHHLRHVRPRNDPNDKARHGHDVNDHSLRRRLFHRKDESSLTMSHGESDNVDRDEEDGNVPPLRISKDLDDQSESERKLQLSTEANWLLSREEKWYVNWVLSRCVQSCAPTSTNPHCDGRARWDQHLFESADHCCRITLSWQPMDDCTATGHPDTAMTTLSEVKSEYCPDEYDQQAEYAELDQTALYSSETEGNVYECKEGPLSQYCNVFPPNWTRVNTGGGMSHASGDLLGWTLLGDCEREPVIPTAGNTDGWYDGDGRPYNGSSEGANLNNGQNGDGMEWVGGNGSGGGSWGAVSPADGGAGRPSSASKPVGGRPNRPVRPTSQTGSAPAASPSSGEWLGQSPSHSLGSISFGSGNGRPSSGSGNGTPSSGSGNGNPSSGSGNGNPSSGSGNGTPSSGSGNGAPSIGSGTEGYTGDGWIITQPGASSPTGGSSGLSGPSGSISLGSGNDGPSNGSGNGSPSNGSGNGGPSNGSGNGRPSNGSGNGRPSDGSGNGGPSDGSGNGRPSDASQSVPTGTDADTGAFSSAGAYVKPVAAQKPPGQDNADGGDGNDSTRPRPVRPTDPARPYKPKPAIQVQSAPEGGEDDPLMMDEDGDIQCWRSGTICESDAEIFACCTACINGICI